MRSIYFGIVRKKEKRGVIMKKYFTIIYLFFLSGLYAEGARDKLMRRFSEVEVVLRELSSDINNNERQKTLSSFELEHAILTQFLLYFGKLVRKGELDKKIDRFLRNVHDERVLNCFARLFQEKKQIIEKIDDIDKLGESRATGDGVVSSQNSIQKLENDLIVINEQLYRLLVTVLEEKYVHKFKCSLEGRTQNHLLPISGLPAERTIEVECLNKVSKRLRDIEESLKICKREIALGYKAKQYAKDRLELERDILMLFFREFEQFMHSSKLDKLVDRFLDNIRLMIILRS